MLPLHTQYRYSTYLSRNNHTTGVGSVIKYEYLGRDTKQKHIWILSIQVRVQNKSQPLIPSLIDSIETLIDRHWNTHFDYTLKTHIAFESLILIKHIFHHIAAHHNSIVQTWPLINLAVDTIWQKKSSIPSLSLPLCPCKSPLDCLDCDYQSCKSHSNSSI